MDDISISTSSTSLSKNMRVLSREVDALFRKGNELAIQFDPAKTELIHFTTGAAAPSTSLTLPDLTVVKPKKVVRWLGILFDDALSFKQHVSFLAGQATSAFFRMCRLANSERGLSAFAMRQLYMACVVSVADYGSPIYWKDQVFIETKLQSLQNLALRKILGTFRTSPVKPSEVEAALPPPNIRLNTNTRKYAFRARKLPPQHPIHARLTRIWNPGGADYDSDDSQSSEKTVVKGPFSQMQRIGWSISEFLFDDEKIVHNCFRPWQREAPFVTTISSLSKDEEAQAHNKTMLSSMGTNLLAIYSDASSVPKGNGIGVAITVRDCSIDGKETHFDTTNIGNQQIVYDGELEGIARAFEYAAEVATTGQQIQVYADNQAAIHRIKNPSDNPGQAWQLRCFHAAAEVASKQAFISLHWAPGHEGVDGNERADSLAKGAALARPNSRSTSLAMTGIRIKNRTEMEWRLAFSRYSKSAIEQNPSTYAKLFKWKFRKRLAIPPGTKRELTSTFYQLKLGHCYAKAYLARFGKADSDRCSCGAVQTREHLLLSCKWYRLERRELQNDIGEKELTLRLLLQTKKGIAATFCFLEKTKIATRKWQLGQNDDS